MSEIVVASYNFNHGSNKPKLLSNMVFLAEQNVDVFCLQELRTNKQETFIGEDILALLGEDWKGEFLLSYNSKNDYGLGMIWNSKKLNLQSFQSIDLPILKGMPRLQSMIEQYFLSGDASPVKRAANVAVFQSGDKSVRVSNLHADWHGGQSHRLSQIKFLLDHLDQEPVDAEVICGDFNTIGLFENAREMAALYELLGPEYAIAFPKFQLTTFHGQHLDHIFAKNCTIEKAQIHRILGSDHFPVVAHIKL
jgi:endonuclease/exonuclease/phosphatase family metal-dependent hydrolase